MPPLQSNVPDERLGKGAGNLVVAFCEYKAAEYAALHWHYAHRMPVPPRNCFGVWESGQFVGAIIFSRGGSPSLGRRYGLSASEVCELTRVALRAHKTPVTKLVKIALKLLRKHNPGLRAIFSFADANHGHHGGIYQGGNWTYLGLTAKSHYYVDRDGKHWHSREVMGGSNRVRKQFNNVLYIRKADCRRVKEQSKHRYAYALDPCLKAKLLADARPYPKAAEVTPATRSSTR